MKIKTFTINVPIRKDRYKHIVSVFSKYTLFDFQVVKCVPHKRGNVSLWLTIKQIIEENKNEPYVIICEDDHYFTDDFSEEKLLEYIEKAQNLEADILNGGVSWFDIAVQINTDFFWLKTFNGTQFMVVFKKFFEKITTASFNEKDSADFKISSLSENIFTFVPFISKQKEFGYSDVTIFNNEKGKVERLFAKTSERLNLLKKVKTFYTHF
ncbi:hypothetical protein [Capnocytophaga canimorsus]|uniref:hypothetical protein n=1 Tax=Capnocytophaga canimorsus TaxID=28188 RepID=UPI001EDD540A|nr:hypothetical protein [Capnocytophaga canimorsus]GJQ04853.1 glycosyl transferase [Capnocytophaga canimorsus]